MERDRKTEMGRDRKTEMKRRKDSGRTRDRGEISILLS